jgi:hypothetical protein
MGRRGSVSIWSTLNEANSDRRLPPEANAVKRRGSVAAINEPI